MNGVFITGTDTGVGKTTACAAVVSILRRAGIDAVPMKPVQTGAVERDGVLRAPDLEFCLASSGLSVSEDEKRLMSPFIFKKPCSPHLASELEGKAIDISIIMDAFRNLSASHEAVVVEGAGGILVPLGEKLAMLDLMSALSLPVILVARPGLGTINHTLLSLNELGRAGSRVAGVMIAETELAERGDIEEDNIRTIERVGRVRVLGRIPFIPGLNDIEKTQPVFMDKCAACLPPAEEWMKIMGGE